MAVSLAEQVKFPELEGWEDTPQKLRTAKESVQALRQYLDLHKQKAEELKAREETKKVARERVQQTIAKRQSLESLSAKLTELSKQLGTQAAGYEFQNWFYDLVGFFEMTKQGFSAQSIAGTRTSNG